MDYSKLNLESLGRQCTRLDAQRKLTARQGHVKDYSDSEHEYSLCLAWLGVREAEHHLIDFQTQIELLSEQQPLTDEEAQAFADVLSTHKPAFLDATGGWPIEYRGRKLTIAVPDNYHDDWDHIDKALPGFRQAVEALNKR